MTMLGGNVARLPLGEAATDWGGEGGGGGRRTRTTISVFSISAKQSGWSSLIVLKSACHTSPVLLFLGCLFVYQTMS